MKIQDLLRKDVMLLDLQATEKTAVIEEISLRNSRFTSKWGTALLYYDKRIINLVINIYQPNGKYLST